MTYIPAKAEKLNFECQLCGECCRNNVVPVTIDEVKNISNATKRPASNLFFKATHEYGPINQNYLHLRRKKAGDSLCCIFLHDNNCLLHELNLKPVNCRHVPYALIEEHEVKDWSEADKDECRVEASLGGMPCTVYFAVLESCKGTGKGEEIDSESLKDELVEQQRALVETSSKLDEGIGLTTEHDDKFLNFGRELISRKGAAGKATKEENVFSFMVHPKELIDKISKEKILGCVLDSGHGENAVFRFSILENGVAGILCGYLEDYEKEEILDRMKAKEDEYPPYGVIDLGKDEYYYMV